MPRKNTQKQSVTEKHRLLVPLLAFAAVFAGIAGYRIVASNASTCLNYTWRVGSSGQCVRVIQYNVGRHTLSRLAIDGSYGSQTKSGVMLYQSSRGLTADGLVGPKTWDAICYDLRSSRFGNAESRSYASSAGCR